MTTTASRVSDSPGSIALSNHFRGNLGYYPFLNKNSNSEDIESRILFQSLLFQSNCPFLQSLTTSFSVNSSNSFSSLPLGPLPIPISHLPDTMFETNKLGNRNQTTIGYYLLSLLLHVVLESKQLFPVGY